MSDVFGNHIVVFATRWLIGIPSQLQLTRTEQNRDVYVMTEEKGIFVIYNTHCIFFFFFLIAC